MNKQDAIKVIKPVKDDLNDWIQDQEKFTNEQISYLYKQDDTRIDDEDFDQKYSHKIGKLHMLLELKRYINYEVENYVINDLEYKKRIQ